MIKGPVKKAATIVNTPTGPPITKAMTVTNMSWIMRQRVYGAPVTFTAIGATASMGDTPMRVFKYIETPSVNTSVPATRCTAERKMPSGKWGTNA